MCNIHTTIDIYKLFFTIAVINKLIVCMNLVSSYREIFFVGGDEKPVNIPVLKSNRQYLVWKIALIINIIKKLFFSGRLDSYTKHQFLLELDSLKLRLQEGFCSVPSGDLTWFFCNYLRIKLYFFSFILETICWIKRIKFNRFDYVYSSEEVIKSLKDIITILYYTFIFYCLSCNLHVYIFLGILIFINYICSYMYYWEDMEMINTSRTNLNFILNPVDSTTPGGNGGGNGMNNNNGGNNVNTLGSGMNQSQNSNNDNNNNPMSLNTILNSTTETSPRPTVLTANPAPVTVESGSTSAPVVSNINTSTAHITPNVSSTAPVTSEVGSSSASATLNTDPTSASVTNAPRALVGDMRATYMSRTGFCAAWYPLDNSSDKEALADVQYFRTNYGFGNSSVIHIRKNVYGICLGERCRPATLQHSTGVWIQGTLPDTITSRGGRIHTNSSGESYLCYLLGQKDYAWIARSKSGK